MFVLGPFLDNVIEPLVEGVVPPVAGFRGIAFGEPPTSPGGNVHVKLLPAVSPGDANPTNLYAFFVQPVASVPSLADRTADWFFKSGSPSGSIHVGAADSDGALTIAVAGVAPSLQPYFVQTVLEYPG